MAPSFLRVGSFEALNPPSSLFLIGGPQQQPHWEGLRVLGEWVGRRVLRLEGVEWEGENRTAWSKKLILEVTKRNAKMVAGWQVWVIPATSRAQWAATYVIFSDMDSCMVSSIQISEWVSDDGLDAI